MPRTPKLPGTDGEIPSLRSKAEAYIDARDRRMAMTQAEVAAKDALLDEMHAHKRTKYEDAEVLIEITIEKEKLKVRTKTVETVDEDAEA